MIPVLLCFDVEPKERQVDPVAQVDWFGFEEAVDLIEELRPKMAAATGREAKASWFLRMDPQIVHVYGDAGWGADRYRAVLDSLVNEGDELGIHLHPWKWNEAKAKWIQDFADQSWVAYCVETAFAAFQQSFGSPCRAFRFGDRWMNDETLDLVVRLGATSDSTIEPGHIGTESPDDYIGTWPDYTNAQRRAYRPSRRDFMTPGSADDVLDVVMIPVQSAPAVWGSSPAVGLAGGVDKPAYEGRLDVASMAEIVGWAWDRNNPERRIDVDVMCDGERLGTVGAIGLREDLVAAGKGDGKHAFRLATPLHLKDGRPHRISARVAGAGVDLAGGPLVLQGLPEPDSDAVTMYLDHHSFTFGLLLDRLLEDPTTNLLTLKVRSDFGCDQHRMSYVRANLEHLIEHPMAKRFEFMTVSEFVEHFDRQCAANAAN